MARQRHSDLKATQDKLVGCLYGGSDAVTGHGQSRLVAPSPGQSRGFRKKKILNFFDGYEGTDTRSIYSSGFAPWREVWNSGRKIKGIKPKSNRHKPKFLCPID